MEFKNETWRKIRVHKETSETPTPLMTVRSGDVVSVTKTELIEEYEEAGLTSMGGKPVIPKKSKSKKKNKGD